MTQVSFITGENNAGIHDKLNQAVQGYRFIRRTIFSGIPGPTAHRCHPMSTGLHASMVGPGGGGAGVSGGVSGDAAAGRGGGAGMYSEIFLVNNILYTIPLTILAPRGGSGGSSGNTPGVTPSSGAAILYQAGPLLAPGVPVTGQFAELLKAHPGFGGASMTPGTAFQITSAVSPNTNTGVPVGTTIGLSIPGEGGYLGIRYGANLAVSGRGGASYYGAGGQEVIGPAPGRSAPSNGAGGSGGASTGANSMAGGDGGNALVVLDEYY